MITKIAKSRLKPLMVFPFKIIYRHNLFNSKKIWPSLFFNPDNTTFVDELKKIVVSDIYYHKFSDEERNIFNKKYIWGKYAKAWHDNQAKQYLDKPFHDKDLEQLVYAIKEREIGYKKVIEVGTGHGMALKYFSEVLSEDKSYLGLDINEATIMDTKDRFKNNKELSFEYRDFFDFIENENIDDTIFIFHGTLEFFNQNDILKMLEIIKMKSCNFMIALHEPCNINLESVKESQPRGSIAYSHNYPYLFELANIKIIHLDISSIDIKTPNYNNVQLIGLGSGLVCNEL